MTDNAGNTLNTARSITLSPVLQVFTDAVGTTDPVDLYRFRFASRSSLSLSLTNLGGNADLELLDSSGTIVSVNGVSQASNNGGTLAETINTILPSGTYYIRVAPAAGNSLSSYSLLASSVSGVRNDILWRNYSTGSHVTWFMQGTSPIGTVNFSAPVFTNPNWSAEATGSPLNPNIPDWRIEATGDFTGDGQSDIVWRNLTDGSNLIWTTLGDSALGNIALPGFAGREWRIQGTGDFTGDGQTDLIWRNTSTGEVRFWQMDGTNFVATLALNGPFVSTEWSIQGAADFTGDGQVDIFWRNFQTGANVVWQMNGTSAVGTINLPTQADVNFRVAGLADYSGDGQPDIVWRNYGNGTNLIWTMNGNAIANNTTILQVPIPDWQMVAPFSRFTEPTLPDPAGNTSTTPFQIGQLNGNGAYLGFVGNSDTADFYQFSLPGAADITLQLTGLSRNANVQILTSSGGALTPPAEGTNTGTTAESITRTLAAGTYYIRVFQAAVGENTNYTLSLAANNLPTQVNNRGLTVIEGAPNTPIGTNLLQFVDANNPADQVTYRVTTVPQRGSLRLNNVALTNGQTFTQADIDAGRLSYLNDGNEFTSDSFIFEVSDGIITTPIGPVTFAITITATNDNPVLAANTSLVGVSEGGAAVSLSSTNLLVTDVDNTVAQITYTLKTPPARGALRLNGVNIQANGTFTQADISGGLVSYLNNGSEFTSDSFVFTVSDGSGGTIGDTTFTIPITPVNDPPALTINTGLTVNERATLAILGTNLAITDPDNLTRERVYQLTAVPDNGALFLLTPTGSVQLNLTTNNTFTQADVDAGNLSYAHNGNQAISDRFTFTITDDVITTPVGPFTFEITINPINDPPILNPLTPLTVSEGNAVPLALGTTNLSATDPDSSPAQLVYTITTALTNGTLYRNTTALGVGGTFTQSEIIAGAIQYQHDGSETTSDSFGFSLSDGATTLAGNTFNFIITPTNDAPVITVPPTLTVGEDVSLNLTGISISDDSGNSDIEVTVSVLNGTLTLGATGGLTVTPNTGSGTTLTVIGRLSAINTALATLSYRGNPNFSGADQLTIAVGDDGNTGGGPGLTDTKTIDITVTPVNDPPILNPIGAFTVNENDFDFITDTVLSVTDIDNLPGQIVYTVGTLPTRGTLLLNGVALDQGGTFTQADLNSGSALRYQHDGSETTSDTFTFTVTDGGTTTRSGTFNITVTPVNDQPILTVPGAQTVAEDLSLSLTGISIADDSGTGNIQVTLSALNGTLTLGALGGVTVVPNTGTGSSLTVTGRLSSINTALASLSYRGNLNFSGADQITIEVDDNGNTGGATGLTDTKTIDLTITPVNDAPVLDPIGAFTVLENDFRFIDNSLLNTTDVDNPPDQIVYTVGTLPTRGTLLLNGVALTAGGTFTQADLDAGNVLRYQHDGSETTSDSFAFTVTDGGTTTRNGTFNITVTPVNDQPVITVPGAQTVAEDQSLTLAGISIADDSGTNSITVSLSVVNGLLTASALPGVGITGSGTGTVTLTGTLTNLNTALGGVSYQGNPNFNGLDTLTVEVNDGGFTGGGPGLTDTKTIDLTVTPVNDAPTLTAPGAQTVVEDTNLSINGFTVNDVDAGTSPVQVTLTATQGVLTVNTAGLTFVTGDGTADSTMTFTGTLAAVGTALNSLVYRGNQDYNGSDTITVVLDDQGNTGGTAQSIERTIAVTVTPANDAPVITVPLAQNVSEDTNLTITGISIADVDAGNGLVEVDLSVASGVLTLGSFTGLSFITGDGTADSTIVFRGNLTNVNAALNNLVYRGTSNFNGADLLTLDVDDRGNTGGAAQTASATLDITVNGVNDGPILTAPASITTTEDNTVAITGVTVSDIDVLTGEMLVTLATTNGLLSLAPGAIAGLTFTTGDGTSDGSMTFTGTLAEISAALAGLTYQGTPDFNGTDVISLTVDDQGNTGGAALSADRTINVTVSAVNDAPVLTVPTGGITVDEDATTTIAGISIADVDALAGNLRVTLSVSTGVITLSSTTGLTFTSGGNGTRNMTFTGSLSNINTALENLRYRGNANVSGADVLNISVNDQGNTGTGGSLSDTDTIAITVNPINDGPVLTVPTSRTVNEDTDLVITGITIADLDARPTDDLEMTLTASNGILTLGSTAGITFVGGSANGTGSLIFRGTRTAIGTALTNLRYRGNQDFNGADEINLTVDDLGNFGNGGPLTDSKTIAVTVNSVNDAPTLAFPGAQTVLEDQDLTITGITIADVDAGLNPVQMTLTVTSGTITLNSTAGLAFTAGDGTADSTMTFSGTLTDINTALDNLVYRGNLNFFGNDTLTITANDRGNEGSGGVRNATPGTIAITITADNDPPVLVNNNPLTISEGRTLAIRGGSLRVTDAEDGPANVTYTLAQGPANGSLRRNNNPLANNATFTQADIDAGLITYVHLGGENTTDQFTFTVADTNGGTIGNTVFNIVVEPVNDVPTLLNIGATANEGGTVTLNETVLLATDADNTAGQLVYTITQLPLNGSLRLRGATLGIGSTFTQADVDNDALVYRHNGSETTLDNFVFSLTDGAGGVLNSQTFNLTITAQPDPPVLTTNLPLTVNEGALINLSDTVLRVTDPDTADTAIVYTVRVLPGNGTLRRGGVALSVNDTFTQDDITRGRITYQHDSSESTNDFFRFDVTDGGTTLTNRTFAITVNPVNDAPGVDINDELTVTPDLFNPVTISNSVLLHSDIDNTPAQLTYTINTLPTYGVISRNGVALNVGGTFTQQDIDDGLITYELTSAPAGNDRFRFTVSDGGVGGTLSQDIFTISFI